MAGGDSCPPPRSTRSPPAYHEFVGVGACRDVLQLYWLLWASAVLNVLGLLLGVVTAAVLGAFKDAVSAPAVLAAASALQPSSLRREWPEPAPDRAGHRARSLTALPRRPGRSLRNPSTPSLRVQGLGLHFPRQR